MVPPPGNEEPSASPRAEDAPRLAESLEALFAAVAAGDGAQIRVLLEATVPGAQLGAKDSGKAPPGLVESGTAPVVAPRLGPG